MTPAHALLICAISCTVVLWFTDTIDLMLLSMGRRTFVNPAIQHCDEVAIPYSLQRDTGDATELSSRAKNNVFGIVIALAEEGYVEEEINPPPHYDGVHFAVCSQVRTAFPCPPPNTDSAHTPALALVEARALASLIKLRLQFSRRRVK